MPTVESLYRPTPPQRWFLNSPARVKGFGGAMSGGKTKTMCEAALDLLLDNPGIWGLAVRQKHTAITATTRHRFMQICPEELIYRKKESQGEDWVMVKTEIPGVYSKLFFIGLDDPVRWFSSEIGFLLVDEAHETAERDIHKLMTRLRQRCPACEKDGSEDCEHFPHVSMLGFNPENPNHWLRRWFIVGAGQTDFGFYKKELYVTDGEAPIGDCEFVIAKATDNPYNSRRYIEQTLGGMSAFERRRYLEGEWLFVSGQCFFDQDALGKYHAETEQPWKVAESKGALTGTDKNDKIRFRPTRGGPWAVFRAPVRAGVTRDERGQATEQTAHRYIVAVDPSSGGSTDYSGIQVLDVEEFAQVAEFQGKMDPDLIADEAFRAACVYNGATIVVETTGGWGASVVRRIDHDLLPAYKGRRETKPRLYLRRKEDRLKKIWTDVMGWDTNTHTRALMLDTLEQAIRERSLTLRSERTLQELLTFVWAEKKNVHGGPKSKAGAQAGECDDLVLALAMAVVVYAQQPKVLRRYRPPEHAALVGATGY